MRPGPVAAAILLALAAGCGDPAPSPAAGPVVVRVGHFPNVTHAHGLVGHALTRSGRGWFEERLGPGVKVEWFTYNAGPAAMEAVLTGAVDLTYVGPSPAVNAHSRSKGAEVRVLAGATRGGAALVVQGASSAKGPADFRGLRVATPQLGNTQDVACRAWFIESGLKVTMTGGDVTILPTHNPDQLALFLKGDIDAVWTVEPWVSRLEAEAKGRVLLEEKDAVTTVLAARAKFLEEKPDLARRFVAAHRELTKWLGEHGAEAKALVRQELKEETTREPPADLIDRCFARMRFADAVAREDFDASSRAAVKAGLLAEAPDLSRLVTEAK
jgi:NitT/TauT family transport system substrate-binding protein